MILVGIDPGADGAFAFHDTEARSLIDSFSMPTLNISKSGGTSRIINWSALHGYIELALKGRPVGYAFVERVQSSPQMGVTSAFNFGRGYGGLESLVVALKWPHEFVTPAKWKKALAVPVEEDDILNRANHLMPVDTHHWLPQRLVMTKVQAVGRAEAALLCRYGAVWLSERGQVEAPSPEMEIVAVEQKVPRRKLPAEEPRASGKVQRRALRVLHELL